MSPSNISLCTIINALGTLILAIVAILALFVPSILKKLYEPKFNFALYPIKNNNNTELSLKITNNGKNPAHDCKVAIEIYEDKKFILNSFLAWDIKNYSKMIDVQEGAIGFGSSFVKKPFPVTYGGINLYENEYQFVKLFFNYKDTYCIYGFPFNENSDEEHPIKSGNTDESILKFGVLYEIKIRIFSEERSQYLGSLFFKICNNEKYKITCRYGYNKNNLDFGISINYTPITFG
ncbi:hypothetical protein [Ferroplasma sp.]|uniref:hypothetical protein n=1 Tax=Ferroplasma sp. TaxID=2591003 RepID=UPI00262B0A8D|nr:hypothetical protein [Ferroplasma sp.]